MNKISVIGLGRVGLPLSLFLESLGNSIVGVDRNPEILRTIESRRMPFEEQGCAELLAKSSMKVASDILAVKDSEFIVITVGTPLRMHIETDLSLIQNVLKRLAEVLQKGQTIILRSTVAPGTTEYMRRYIELHTHWRVGHDIGLAFCPERLAENRALEELMLLPQIIGTEDIFSAQRAMELFKPFNVNIFETNFLSAELVKLFNNTSRYIEFALANQFTLIADHFKQNVYDIIRMANDNYPRGFIRQPGFTAGTCLRKDFGMINELHSAPDLLLAAWKVNEFMPLYLVQAVSKCTTLYEKNIAILGYTFKKDSDDKRDSLVPKLIRYIEREVPQSISICEPHLQEKELDGYPNLDLAHCLESADVVFVAMNHECFRSDVVARKKIRQGVWIVDLWNCFGADQLVTQFV